MAEAERARLDVRGEALRRTAARLEELAGGATLALTAADAQLMQIDRDYTKLHLEVRGRGGGGSMDWQPERRVPKTSEKHGRKYNEWHLTVWVVPAKELASMSSGAARLPGMRAAHAEQEVQAAWGLASSGVQAAWGQLPHVQALLLRLPPFRVILAAW